MLPATPRVWLAFLCAPVFAAAAPAPANIASEYALKVWETDDGLPHNAIAVTLQRADGFLWVATQGGLVRFDGLQFEQIQSPLINGPKSSKVVGLAEEDAATLLVATGQSGLLRLRGRELTVHPITAEFRPREPITHVFGEAPNTFWIVFGDREAWRWSNGRIEKFPAPPGVRPMYWVVTFARDAEGGVYLARGAGVEYYEHGRLQQVETVTAATVAIGSSARDGVWFVNGRRFGKIRGRQVLREDFPAPWSGQLAPQIVFEDRAGVLWLGALEGVLRWQDGVAERIVTPHAKLADLRDDDEGNLWVSTAGGGLNRLQRTRLTLVAEDLDWVDNAAGTVSEDGAGNIWFANRKGVRRLTPAGIETVNLHLGGTRRPLVFCPDADGNLWIAASGEVYRMRADGSDSPRLVNTEGGAVHAIYAARDRSIWVGGNYPLLRRHRVDGTIDTFGPREGFNGRSLRCFGEDVTGAVWAGSEEGRVWSMARGRLEEHSLDADQNGGIRAIHGDAAGNVWFGTVNGLLLWQNGKFTRLSTAQGLPDDVLSHILEDDSGWLWFGSRRGIFKVRRTELLECAGGTRAGVIPVTFGRADGLSGISAVGSYQPTAWKTRAGELWFLTRRGLVHTDPARHDNESRLPRIHLSQVVIDGKVTAPAQLAFTSAAHRVEFRFTAPTFVAPERVRFRYRLEGFDNDWIDAGTQRLATYPALRPGRYVFTVAASNGDGAWNPAAATLEFSVQPLWWETWWSRTIAAGLIFAAVVVFVRYWSHRRLVARLARLEQEQRVERERVRIARDLHDDLGASLTHVGMMAEELAEDWSDAPDAPARSSALAERVRGIARDLDAVVWTVSPKNDSLASLAAYISHYAEEYFRHAPIECRAQVATGIPPVPLSPEVRHHLFLIAKELLNNVLKHSQAKRVHVSMLMVAGLFELTIADNGRGFCLDAAEQSGRNGLKNLRARAREAGGALDLVSNAQGTVATLQFRVASDTQPAAAARKDPAPAMPGLPQLPAACSFVSRRDSETKPPGGFTL